MRPASMPMHVKARAVATPLSANRQLTRITALQAQALRAWYGCRLSVPDADGKERIEVRFEPQRASVASMELTLRCAGHQFDVQVVEANGVLRFDQMLVAGMPQALQQATVVHAMGPLWGVIERWLGSPLDLANVRLGGTPWSAEQALGARVTLRESGATAEARVLLRAQHAHGWHALAAARARASAHEVRRDLKLDCAVYTPPVPLRLTELARLGRGDILLLDAPLPGGALTARLGLIAGQRSAGFGLAGIRLQFQPHDRRTTVSAAGGVDASSSTERRHAMTPSATPETEAALAAASAMNAQATSVGSGVMSGQAAGGGLDAVRVDVHVELGRLTLSLATLQSLSAGQVLETQAAIDGDGVVLWCGGQQIALGQLVAVGDRIGVRIVSVPNEATSAGAKAALDTALR